MNSILYKISVFSLLALTTACQESVQLIPPPAPFTATAPPTLASSPTKNAYFGDLHVHTKNSFDAFIFGTRATPDDAYRFAKGAPIENGRGLQIQLSGPPLDFLAVTDHGEYIGVVPALRDRKSPLSKTETAKSIFGLTAKDRRTNFLKIGTTVVSGEEIEEIYDREHMNSVWADTIAAAEEHNAPGVFTTFAGYEFTAMTQVTNNAAANLHRNVIFKDKAPKQLFTTLDSPNPEDLWSWMNEERAAGREVLAIPHNSNASNGQMFSKTSYNGSPLPIGYGANRLRNEPLVEITQVKGTSETHPTLSPNDEWADFELYDNLIGSANKSTVLPGSFIRQALERGLGLETVSEINPYKFGLIGSSDTHLGASSLSEENHFGKFPHDSELEIRQSTPPDGAKKWPQTDNRTDDLVATQQYGASGLAGVWATENTREALFTSMQTKETFATSGPRIRVRMFGSYDYTPLMLTQADMLEQAYAGGVPMGGELKAQNNAPSFVAWAIQDPNGTPLQRLQIVKVVKGQETVYDVSCAGGGTVNPATYRCADNSAKVDISTCATNDETGATELKTLWQDPNYDAMQNAVYYVRALENPKCRWSTWDAVRNGTPPNPNMKTTVQDRAWGSPIWVKSSDK